MGRFQNSIALAKSSWAIVSATVSIVLRAIEQRGGIFGRIIGSIAGVAWTVVTFLVLPVLVFEGLGPMAAVKRSGELFKRTWGENLVTIAGIGIGLFVVWVVAVGLVSSTLTGIFQVALYRFATGSPVPGFDQSQLE